MQSAELGLQSFDSQTLSILYGVFDHAVAELNAGLTDVNRHRIHTAIAKEIILLAAAGQVDPIQLKHYATSCGRTAIAR